MPTKNYSPPITILPILFFLETDPATIDINIHPTKTEIKFEDEPAIFQILTASTREALGKFNLVPSIDFDTERAIEIPPLRKNESFRIPQISYNAGYNPFELEKKGFEKYASQVNGDTQKNWEKLYTGPDILPNEPHRETDPESEQQLKWTDPETGSRFLQLKNKYILTAVKSGLMVIDQHKAHERILYEKYLHSIGPQPGNCPANPVPRNHRTGALGLPDGARTNR